MKRSNKKELKQKIVRIYEAVGILFLVAGFIGLISLLDGADYFGQEFNTVQAIICIILSMLGVYMVNDGVNCDDRWDSDDEYCEY